MERVQPGADAERAGQTMAMFLDGAVVQPQPPDWLLERVSHDVRFALNADWPDVCLAVSSDGNPAHVVTVLTRSGRATHYAPVRRQRERLLERERELRNRRGRKTRGRADRLERRLHAEG
jgi:hypothetical protein